MDVQFEWDPEKAKSNIRKYCIGFNEGCKVFKDPLAYIFDNEVHSEHEQREIIIGHSSKGRLLLVCFVEVKINVARIVSVRRATKRERTDYEEN